MLVQHSSQKDRLGKSVYIYIYIYIEVSRTGLHRRRRYNQEEQYRYGLRYRCASSRRGFNGLGNYNEIDGKVSTNNVTSLRVCPITWSSRQWTNRYENFADVIYRVKEARNSTFFPIPVIKYFSKRRNKNKPRSICTFYRNFPYILFPIHAKFNLKYLLRCFHDLTCSIRHLSRIYFNIFFFTSPILTNSITLQISNLIFSLVIRFHIYIRNLLQYFYNLSATRYLTFFLTFATNPPQPPSR